MKNLKKGRTLSRTSVQRRALLRSMTVSLLLKKRITTTLAKAKELRPYAEKIITKGKDGDINNLRLVKKELPKEAVKELFKVIGLKVKNRNGGYTRIYKLSPRKSDAAKMAMIELVDFDYKTKDEKKTKEAKSKEKNKTKKVKKSNDSKKNSSNKEEKRAKKAQITAAGKTGNKK